MVAKMLPESQEFRSSTAEVEFALVLSRMVDVVSKDPEQLRHLVYELARYKLREQIEPESATDVDALTGALETAIQGHEAFSKKEEREGSYRLSHYVPAVDLRTPRVEMVAHVQRAPTRFDGRSFGSVTSQGHRRKWTINAWRLGALLGLFVVAAIALPKWIGRSAFVEQNANSSAVSVSPNLHETLQPRQTQKAEEPKARASPVLPTAYGVYAVSAGELYNMDLLPGRVPDVRVAISAAINKPSRTMLPDGHLRFVVFRRDSASNAPDRAEVRVVAKISRAMTFDSSGKPIVAKADDSWVIRNIAYPYRAGPSQDSSDMYDVQSEDPNSALSPGRYVLVLKGQAYDFTVSGVITDPAKCLERIAATNGSFYSECRKP